LLLFHEVLSDQPVQLADEVLRARREASSCINIRTTHPKEEQNKVESLGIRIAFKEQKDRPVHRTKVAHHVNFRLPEGCARVL
jgi:hypothetical protein